MHHPTHLGMEITLTCSKFLKELEQRYTPVEGKALIVAWALEDIRFLTLRCDDLVIATKDIINIIIILVATDHKPLTKIFD